MNVTRLAVALGLGIFAASTGFVACSGDDSSPSVPRADAGPDSTVDSGNEDAEADAQDDGNPRAPDPKRIRCGNNNTRCDTDDQYCCVRDGGFSCLDEDVQCQGGIEVGCDEAADCDRDEVCCGSTAGGGVSVECKLARSCNNPFENRRICKTDAECGDAGACVTQPCKGVIISTCGGIPPSLCAN